MEVVLTVRRRREDTEERVLADLLRRRQDAKQAVELVKAELDTCLTHRLADLHTVRSGAERSQDEAMYRGLRGRSDQAEAELSRIEQMCFEQTAIYGRAQCDREAISQVLDRRKAMSDAASTRAEQKSLDDLFASRAVRARDIAASSAGSAEHEAGTGGVRLHKGWRLGAARGLTC